MKLGFKLRRFVTKSINFLRESINFINYLIWLLFDFNKFKNIDNTKIKNLLIVYTAHLGDMLNVQGLVNSIPRNVKVYFLTEERRKGFLISPLVNYVDVNTTKELIENNKLDAVILMQGARMMPYVKNIKKLFKKIPYKVSCERVSFHPVYFFKTFFIFGVNRKTFSVCKSGFKDHLECFRLLGFNISRPIFYYNKDSEKRADEFIKKINKPIIFIHPSSGKGLEAINKNNYPAYLWLNERWTELIDKLIEKYNVQIIIDGVIEENKIIDEIINKSKYKKQIIKVNLSISDLASLYKRGKLLISLDTFNPHLASQVDLQVIDLYRFYPDSGLYYGSAIHIYHPEVCNNCRKLICPEGNNICMKSINVDEVLKEVKGLIK